VNLFALVNGSPWFFGPVTFSGSITFAGTALFANGTIAAPSIAFSAYPAVGFYLSGPSEVNLGLGDGVFRTAQWYKNGPNTYFTIFAPSSTTHYLTLQSTASGQFIVAGGTNQNITITPSGAGSVLLGASGGNITAASGVGSYTFSDAFGYGMSVSGANLVLGTVGVGGITFKTGAGVDAARILSNQNFLIGTAVDSSALLQVGTNTTTAAGGMKFGTDVSVYRAGSEELNIRGTNSGTLRVGSSASTAYNFKVTCSATDAALALSLNDTAFLTTTGFASPQTLSLKTVGTTALTLDSSQRTILSGALRLANAYVAGAPAAAGYVTLQDSTGTTYKVLVGT
jgi:hypothetical protein